MPAALVFLILFLIGLLLQLVGQRDDLVKLFFVFLGQVLDVLVLVHFLEQRVLIVNFLEMFLRGVHDILVDVPADFVELPQIKGLGQVVDDLALARVQINLLDYIFYDICRNVVFVVVLAEFRPEIYDGPRGNQEDVAVSRYLVQEKYRSLIRKEQKVQFGVHGEFFVAQVKQLLHLGGQKLVDVHQVNV